MDTEFQDELGEHRYRVNVWRVIDDVIQEHIKKLEQQILEGLNRKG